ncbi:hypothetical protein ABZV91_08215 [Nocardia sp. NPDC004568]|uniref:hypothetical protein n=1 Tax=Nocardia sp. NPDC004568 TaxID=3154551 RepID=UPI00339E9676
MSLRSTFLAWSVVLVASEAGMALAFTVAAVVIAISAGLAFAASRAGRHPLAPR